MQMRFSKDGLTTNQSYVYDLRNEQIVCITGRKMYPITKFLSHGMSKQRYATFHYHSENSGFLDDN